MRIKDIDKFNYVSFDIYDTLLYRTVNSPSDIFRIVAKLFRKELASEIYFVNQRIKAERIARCHKGSSEISIYDIYENIDINNALKSKLLAEEIRIEENVCCVNKNMVDILNVCHQRGKKIVITSDMYLPIDSIKRLLDKHEIYYDFLFLSSDKGETKRSGKLFDIILNELSIRPNELVHLGDDDNNDILQPLSKGIQAFLRIPAIPADFKDKQSHKKDISISILNNFFRISCSKTANPAEKIGYTIIGPFLYAFCIWLHYKKKLFQLDKLLFVAREGYFIKRCYLALFPDENDQVEYIYLNKNLLRAPLLKVNPSVDIWINSIPKRRFYTWKEIFNYLNIEDPQCYFSDVNYSEKVSYQEITEGKYRDTINRILACNKTFYNEQDSLLLKYLKQHNLTSLRVGLVNNSINGSGQSMLEDYLKYKGENGYIYGLQFDSSQKCKKLLKDRYSSFLQEQNVSNFNRFLFKTKSLVLEHLLFKKEGTALKFYSNEFNIAAVSTATIRKEKDNYNIVSSIQDGAIQFITSFSMSCPISLDNVLLNPFFKLLKKPSQENAKLIGNLYDDDMDGDKKIVDDSVPFSWKFINLVNIPNNINWMEGYLRQKKYHKITIFLYHLRLILTFYKHNLFDLKQDVLRCLEIIFGKNSSEIN